MIQSIQLSEVQRVNLSLLTAIRDGIQRDPVLTCCQFRIDANQASFFRELSVEQIIEIVTNFGHECLCTLRPDILSLLQLPPPLTGHVVAVRPHY